MGDVPQKPQWSCGETHRGSRGIQAHQQAASAAVVLREGIRRGSARVEDQHTDHLVAVVVLREGPAETDRHATERVTVAKEPQWCLEGTRRDSSRR
ncbi:hypothetical protein M2167_006677 [Streptomyces sp. SPB4]|nr:hypothetical protein [Streptomyces sp. SPB4]